MDPINALKAQRIKAKEALLELLKAHEAAAQVDDRGFTDDEKTAQATAEAKIAEIDERVTVAERVREMEHAANKRAGTTAIEVKAPNFSRDPFKGFGHGGHRDFVLAVMRDSDAGDVAQIEDERLRFLAQRTSSEDRKAVGSGLSFMLPVGWTPGYLGDGFRATAGSDEHGTYDDRYGGATVGRTILPGLLQVGFEGDPTVGRVQNIPMATPSVALHARTDKDHTSSVSGGFTVSRRAETVALSTSRAATEMVELKASSLFGGAYITEELLADSPISFAAVVDSGFRSQFSAHMLNEKLRGLGGNQYLGILTALASASLGPTVSVAKETGQAADTIVGANLVKMAARAWGLDQCIFLANHDTRTQLYQANIPIAGAAAIQLYQPTNRDGFPDMLLGRPVFYTEFADKLGDQGDIILFNGSQFLYGLYQPLQSAESIHVRFLNHERTLKFWLRDCGAPWWKAALTPNQSSDTLSPFVVLDARA